MQDSDLLHLSDNLINIPLFHAAPDFFIGPAARLTHRSPE